MNAEMKPNGRGARWMRMISNVGFGLAIVYTIYLATSLMVSARGNSSLEGQPFGSVDVEFIRDVADVTKLAKAPLASSRDGLGPIAGRSVIVVWATWCGPCHSLLVDLKAEVLNGTLDPDRVVAVSIGETFGDVSAYLQRTPLPFRVALDREQSLSKRMKIAGTPTVIFLDEQGIMQRVSTGGFRLASGVLDFVR